MAREKLFKTLTLYLQEREPELLTRAKYLKVDPEIFSEMYAEDTERTVKYFKSFVRKREIQRKNKDLVSDFVDKNANLIEATGAMFDKLLDAIYNYNQTHDAQLKLDPEALVEYDSIAEAIVTERGSRKTLHKPFDYGEFAQAAVKAGITKMRLPYTQLGEDFEYAELREDGSVMNEFNQEFPSIPEWKTAVYKAGVEKGVRTSSSGSPLRAIKMLTPDGEYKSIEVVSRELE